MEVLQSWVPMYGTFPAFTTILTNYIITNDNMHCNSVGTFPAFTILTNDNLHYNSVGTFPAFTTILGVSSRLFRHPEVSYQSHSI